MVEQRIAKGKIKEKHIGLTVRKEENFSEWFSQICSEQGADLADLRYGVQGFIVHKPWAFKILRKIYAMFEKVVEADGHEPFLFPTVIPEENLMKEKEHAGFAPNVFWVTHAGEEKLERRIALRPTGETALYPMYSLWIRSYNDLPFKRYQSRITVFRNEMTTRPFLRGREFMFFETHDVFRTHKEALEQIKKDMRMMEEIVWNRLKIPFIFFKRPQWDKFKGADDTYASDTLLPDGRRNQISSTHDLGLNFAKAFDIKFKDADGKDKYGWQTCFGPGIWRIMAALIAVHGDNTGLVLPFCVAPVQVVIVPILFSRKKSLNKRILSFAKQIEMLLRKENVAVLLDDSEQTPGYKFNQWEMLGVPIRIEIGPKEVETESLKLVSRYGKEKHTKANRLKAAIKTMVDEFELEMEKRAKNYFSENTKDASSLKEVENIIREHKGFVRVPFCSIDADGADCASILKERTTADVCGVRFENPEKVPKGSTCLICGKPAKHIVYVAKSI